MTGTPATDDDKVLYTMLSWCHENRHADCKRAYRRFLIDPKTNKVQWLDEIVKCSCKKRGCKCYTVPAERPKAARKTRRKK